MPSSISTFHPSESLRSISTFEMRDNSTGGSFISTYIESSSSHGVLDIESGQDKCSYLMPVAPSADVQPDVDVSSFEAFSNDTTPDFSRQKKECQRDNATGSWAFPGKRKKRFQCDLRFSSYGRRRKNYLLSDSMIKDALSTPCCNNSCLRRFGYSRLKSLRSHYLSLNRQDQFSYLTFSLRLDRSRLLEYSLGNMIVCRKAFAQAHSIGNLRLSRVHSRLKKDSHHLLVDPLSRSVGPIGVLALSWMESYFNKHADVMPTTGKLHLSDNYTRIEVFKIYKDEIMLAEGKFTSYPHFTRLWKQYFNNVSIPKKVRMGICSTCANLKSRRLHSKSEKESRQINEALHLHREQQSMERAKLAKHRKKCFKKPDRYIGIIIDGMDQKKTNLPHFIRIPKDVKEDTFVQIHLVGCLIYSGTLRSQVYLTYPNIHNDANLVITILQDIINNWTGDLPTTLYLQLDNTARENKNQTLLAYLSMLVANEVFVKIKVGFLLVGHTHDHIDQMFSTFSKKLSRVNAFTLPLMIEFIGDAYTPRPTITHMKEVYDFRRFVQTSTSSDRCIEKLNDLSFQHQIRIVRKEDGNTYLFGKQYSNSSEWLPNSGLKFLVYVPTCTIYAAVQEPLETFNLLHQAEKQNQAVDYLSCLEEKRKLVEKAKVYAGNQNTEWWDDFFIEQHVILERYHEHDRTLSSPFCWFSRPSIQNNAADEIPYDLHGLLAPSAREMYLGTRRSRKRQDELTTMWNGCVDELQVGMMIVTLADGDPLGHAFWVAKVMELVASENGAGLLSIKVHWFRTNHLNAFKGKYIPEVIASGSSRGKRKCSKNQPSISELFLAEIDILVYDFTLTSTGHLRKATIDIIKQRIPSKDTRMGGASSSRTTRQNIEAQLGLHRDEDDVIVDSAEEDGSSTSSSSENMDSDDLVGVNTDEDGEL